ncbi:MAG: SocA family protein [Desulfobacterales bacterium]|nr:SocA family protein [Desulfobacterales bacterium]
MIITHHREKLINAIIYFSENTQKCGKTKLLKLLYFLDFRHFKQTGKSVTGLDYYAWDMGPVPRDLFNELSDKMKPDLRAAIKELPKEGFQKIIPKKKFNAEYFSKREIELLENISYIFRDANADEMVESTHLENEPWDKTLKEKGEKEKIDYMLSIDNIDDSLSTAEAIDRKEEISEMHKIFGVA